MVIGNHVIFEGTKQCKAYAELKSYMNKRDREAIFEQRRSLSEGTSFQGNGPYSKTTYSPGADPSTMMIGGGYSTTIHDQGYMIYTTSSGFSITGNQMPGDLEHLFVFDDIATFVYHREKVRAYSIECLDSKQRKFVDEMRAICDKYSLNLNSNGANLAGSSRREASNRGNGGRNNRRGNKKGN